MAATTEQRLHDAHNSPLAQLIKFEDLLDEHEENGVLASLPATSAGFDKISQYGELLPVIWDRLYRLGYLATKTLTEGREQEAKAELHKAVSKMQTDAGLPVDGWIGLQTWKRLQQLFSFENSNDESFPIIDMSKAFDQRAVELRLATLGLLEGPIRCTNRLRDDDLIRWQRLLPILNLNRATQSEAIALLFDIDLLREALAVYFEKCAIHQQYEVPKDIYQLGICIFKIELWLYGYQDIQPGCHGGIPKLEYRETRRNSGSRIQRARDRAINKFSGIASDFIEQNAIDIGKNHPIHILDRCLNYIQSTQKLEAGSSSQVSDLNKLEQTILNLDEHEQSSLKQEMQNQKSFGARLFDGVKRALRWLKRAVGKAIRWVKKKLVWLARTVKKLSNDSASLVRRSFKILQDGVDVLVNKTFPGSSNELAIFRDKDFDFKVFVSDGVPSSAAQAFLKRFSDMMTRLKAATAFVDVIIKTIRNLAKYAKAGPIGLIIVLVKLYKWSQSDMANTIRKAYFVTA